MLVGSVVLGQAADVVLPSPIGFFVLWVGALTAAGFLFTSIRSLWRRGPGRRRLLAAQLRQVVAGGQLAHVESIFGPAHRRMPAPRPKGDWDQEDVVVHSWISPEHVLRCWVTEGVVAGWLVTSRTHRFKPTWFIGAEEITLHKTPLAAVGGGHHPNGIMRGANWFGYMESEQGGRPLWYQQVLVGISEEGLLGRYGAILDATAYPRDEMRRRLDQLREQTAFDTLSVHHGGIPGDDPLRLMLYAADLGREQPRSPAGERLRRWRLRRRNAQLEASAAASSRYTAGAHEVEDGAGSGENQ